MRLEIVPRRQIDTDDTRKAGPTADCVPSCSRTVAYREFASGHDCLLQNPVTLYSLRQKFCVAVLEGAVDGQGFGTWVVVDQEANGLYFVRAELGVNHGPYHVVALHVGCYETALALFSVVLTG